MSKHNDLAFIPGYVDDEGYWHSARSVCCHHWMVTYNDQAKAKVYWPGITDPPEDLECRRCGQKILNSPR